MKQIGPVVSRVVANELSFVLGPTQLWSASELSIILGDSY